MEPAKILIVDDEATTRMIVRHSLGVEPFQLLEAAGGQEALDIAARELPDLIILDIVMPDMDGRTVLRRLQAQDRTRHIRVIVVSALDDDSEVVASLEEGAIDHVTKPFSDPVLRARVHAALRNRGTGGEGRPHDRSARRIGFVGAKGGVGVTTAVANTALAMVATQRRVIAVELRTSPGTLGHQFGLASPPTLLPLLDQGEADDRRNVNVTGCLARHDSGLKLLLSPPAFDDFRELTASQVESILDSLARAADFLLLDTPFPPCEGTAAALRSCDFVVLTVELETTCLASARAMLTGLAAWGVDQDRVGVLLVIRELSAGTTIPVATARSQLECGLIGIVPAVGEANLLALKKGKPLVLAAPDNVAATAYLELSSRLVAERIMTLKF